MQHPTSQAMTFCLLYCFKRYGCMQDLIAAAADDPFIFEGGSRYDYPAMDGRFGQTLDNP